jgi:N-acetyl-alpha-D-glucosaminyl L-malate synthase BshA
VATELGKALADHGHQVHFITYSQPARLDFFSENLFYHEVTVSKYPLFDYPPYELALASRLVDVVQYEQLDILHVHYAIPHASAAYMAKQILASNGIHIPVITTLHGTDITLVGKDRTYKPVVTFSINQSDGVTAVSDNLKKDTLCHFDITNEIRVIPNFIDLERFNHKSKSHFKKAIAPHDEKIIVHTSNFRKVKRVQDVVKVFAKVIEKIPAKLLLAGDGPERIEVEQLCRELNLKDDVRFLGKLDAVEEILSVSDLFILPSETESFGLAALEAMACKLPVISSNAGGIPELNIDGVTGFLDEVGDIDAMANHAIYILEDDTRLNTFKENALKHAKTFDIKNIMPIYEAYYLEVIEKSKKVASS